MDYNDCGSVAVDEFFDGICKIATTGTSIEQLRSQKQIYPPQRTSQFDAKEGERNSALKSSGTKDRVSHTAQPLFQFRHSLS